MTLLDVENLSVTYHGDGGPLYSVKDVSFTIDDGVNYALSGESGSGKSTTAKAILGLLPDHAEVECDRICFDGRDLRTLTPEQRQDVRWEQIAFVPQTAIDALDPVMTVGAQIRQAIGIHRDLAARNARRRARELFETVGLDPGRIDDYPHEFSGGMRQRVVIAMALALDPDLIIADEPTTGLDVIVQDKIIDNILQVQEETDSSLLLITHDISVIAETCDEMSVLYGGEVMEQGRIDNVLLNPSNPYTMGLKSAFPDLDDDHGSLVSIPGPPPNLETTSPGCVFEPRCPFATEECETTAPSLQKLPYRDQHVACHEAARATAMRTEADDPATWDAGVDGERSPDGEVLLRVDDLHRWYERSGSWLRGLPVGGVSLSFSGLGHRLRELFDRRGDGLGAVFGDGGSQVRAVDGVSFEVSRGEIMGIVGESGCGKSTLAQTLALLQSPTRGGFEFDGHSHDDYQADDLQAFRQKLQIVFQSPYESLNPRLSVGHLVKEPLVIHDERVGERDEVVRETLERVGLAPVEHYLDAYPGDLSGGQRQRVAIARALVVDPDFLICDEPASMLDISLKAEVLGLLRGLANTDRLGILYISHDLATLAQIADSLAIMYLGRFVERGDAERVLDDPRHPYTRSLLEAVPRVDPTVGRDRVTLAGEPPDPDALPDGCRFEPRCSRATGRCRREEPSLEAWTGDRHAAACFHPVAEGIPDTESDHTGTEPASPD